MYSEVMDEIRSGRVRQVEQPVSRYLGQPTSEVYMDLPRPVKPTFGTKDTETEGSHARSSSYTAPEIVDQTRIGPSAAPDKAPYAVEQTVTSIQRVADQPLVRPKLTRGDIDNYLRGVDPVTQPTRWLATLTDLLSNGTPCDQPREKKTLAEEWYDVCHSAEETMNANKRLMEEKARVQFIEKKPDEIALGRNFQRQALETRQRKSVVDWTGFQQNDYSSLCHAVAEMTNPMPALAILSKYLPAMLGIEAVCGPDVAQSCLPDFLSIVNDSDRTNLYSDLKAQMKTAFDRQYLQSAE
ncbi:hypothetical protein FACS189472_12550 [Alphaproteobacteria bacterium]|nr:hypothetical protein FACS189472_12550 [Alphaproteobacteria bacterium]